MSITIILPEQTSDAQRARLEGMGIITSSATFAQPGEPSNAVKLEHIRNQFDCPECSIFQEFPFTEIWNNGSPSAIQAAAFMADLRCQYLKHLVKHALVSPHHGYSVYCLNRIYYVRFREQLRMHTAEALIPGYNDRVVN
jgi:hypothetical protein